MGFIFEVGTLPVRILKNLLRKFQLKNLIEIITYIYKSKQRLFELTERFVFLSLIKPLNARPLSERSDDD